MAKRPHVLVTNDDGIHAPGIHYLWKAIEKMADVTVVAPASEQSAVGLSITIRQPLKLERIERSSLPPNHSWSVNGTPSDCVKLALNVVLPSYPDLILSGINRGTNAGRNVLYSGTIAAIIEGVMHNVPGIAFSLEDSPSPFFDQAASYIPSIVEYVLKHPLPAGSFLNVNFPQLDQGVKGIRMARQGKEFWAENPEKRSHPSGGVPYYWLGAKLAQFNESEDSDIAWLNQGYATAVPIHVGELTDLMHIQDHKQRFEDFVNLS